MVERIVVRNSTSVRVNVWVGRRRREPVWVLVFLFPFFAAAFLIALVVVGARRLRQYDRQWIAKRRAINPDLGIAEIAQHRVRMGLAVGAVVSVTVGGLAVGVFELAQLERPPSQVHTVAAAVPVDLFGASGAAIEVSAGVLADPAGAAGQPPAGQRYVTVQLSVTNKGVQAYSPDLAVDFGLEDGAHHRVGTLVPTAEESAAKVAPGATLSGGVTFLVPDGVSVKRVVYAVDGIGSTGPAGVWTVG